MDPRTKDAKIGGDIGYGRYDELDVRSFLILSILSELVEAKYSRSFHCI